MPTNVLIAGGGPAALEAALALRRLAGDRVSLTLLAPEADLTYRPLSVLAPFAAGGATTYPLERMAADIGFTHVRGRLASVDPAAHTVTTVAGERMGYDALLIASGARPSEPFPAATAFAGSLTDQERLHGIVQDVEGGYLHRIAFVVPSGATWPLPLYEIALMLAERAYEMGSDVELHFVTPEAEPLELFGPQAAQEVRKLLGEAGDRAAHERGDRDRRPRVPARHAGRSRTEGRPDRVVAAAPGPGDRRASRGPRGLPRHGRARPRARRARTSTRPGT